MDESRLETTTGMCVVALTKNIMQKRNLPYEDAYKLLLTTELYKLLLDPDTRLFLEPNSYLCNALEEEFAKGTDGLYKYINN